MITTAMMTQVVRSASWRVGQTTLRSSNRDSDEEFARLRALAR